MNILLTCVGRRNYLIHFLKEFLNSEDNVFAANCYPETAGMIVADKSFILPQVFDPNYINELLKICINNNVNILFPLHDIELPLLAQAKDKFLKNNIIVVVSSPKVIEICADKYQTYLFAVKNKLATPKTYLNLQSAKQDIKEKKINFPLVIKSRFGFSSIGIEYAHNIKELHFFYTYVKKMLNQTRLTQKKQIDTKNVIIQEKIEGDEFGLNILNDFHGKYIGSFGIKKLEIRAGETDRAIIIDDTKIHTLGKKISSALTHIGILDLDLIFNNQMYYLLDMNPRIGGQYPFMHTAGVNILATLIAWCKSAKINKQWLNYKPNIISVKGIQLLKSSK